MTKLITVDEVAERYSVTPITIRRWAKAGVIKGMRIGRHTLFTQDALDEYERGRVIPAPAKDETPLEAYYRTRREERKNGRES